MIEYRKGSVFDAMLGRKPVILAHSCNCKGRWGSGVAIGFRENFQNAHNHYVDSCLKYHDENLGTTLLVEDRDNVRVACMFTSSGYGETLDSKESILKNTELAVGNLLHQSEGLEIHMPKINAGLFKVPWEETEAILKKVVPENQKVIVWEL